MLDINLIRSRPDLVRQALLNRGDDTLALDELLQLDVRRREILKQSEQLRATRNTVSKEISRMKSVDDRAGKIAEMRTVGEQITILETELKTVETRFDDLAMALPNIPDASIPVGLTEDDNVVLKTYGEIKTFDFEVKPHWDIGVALGLIDFERGVKLSGSRFYVLHGNGARLQRALIAWMLDLHAAQGYREAYLPFMVKQQTLYAAGQLPKFIDNLYHDVEEDYWMVPTAEVPLTNLHGGEILGLDQLPLHYCAYTPCFRREKMKAGSDVRGIKRGHQFDKVEMYTFCAPENSDMELERMLDDAVAVCKGLELTYRVKLLATGDIGICARKTYDIEVWAPGCDEWLEVSSVSNCGDYQARRANIKFRREPGAKSEFVHTLNGSGLALPRTMIAVMENYQQADGSIVVPEVLRSFVGTDVICKA